MRRRTVILAGAAALVGGALLDTLTTRPLKALPRPSADANLPSRDALWGLIERLNAFGPRLTAAPAHALAVDFIADELAAIGLSVLRDRHRIRRWTAKRTALALGDGKTVPVAAPYPYSGNTSSDGVNGDLVWLDNAKDFAPAQGNIAVVPVKRFDLSIITMNVLFGRKSRLPNKRADFSRGESVPTLGPLTAAAFLPQAREAGARGVICVFEGLSEDLARGQVLPFNTAYADLPAIWVGANEGLVLKEAAAQGASATLVLEAEMADANTDTVYAVLPGGTPNETIIVNTHTDGPNACEENGAAGLLALARAHAARKDRRRSVVFVFATGHFQLPQIVEHGQATTPWLDRHPYLWDAKAGHARAVAGLTLEHLGCTEWKDSATTSRPAPTGQLEREIVYTTNPVMEQVYRASVEGRTKLRSLTGAPRISQIFLGEGAPLYHCGIPSISLVPGPDYLCQILPGGGLERLDPEFAHQQVATFCRALSYLDAMSAEDLGPIAPTIDRPAAFIRYLLTN